MSTFKGSKKSRSITKKEILRFYLKKKRRNIIEKASRFWEQKYLKKQSKNINEKESIFWEQKYYSGKEQMYY